MTDIYLDNNHDISLGSTGDLRLTVEDEKLKQRLTVYLQFLLGEWFLDTTQGIPYIQVIFESTASDLSSVSALLRAEIKRIDGVQVINDLSIQLDRDKRELSVSLTVNSEVTVEVSI